MSTKDNHFVTAILVTHDGQSWLPAVVAALASQTRPIDKVIAVDTGSIDSSTRLLESARISFITTDRNCGFGDAVALAVKEIPKQVKKTNEWIWLIHDDCAPSAQALEKLLEAVEERPQVAMVGPKLLGWHDRTHLLEVGVSIAGNGARWTGLEDLEYDQGQHDGIHDVLAVSTAGALIRREIFEEVGGFDSNLSLFRDDIDFGWRLRVAGHAVLATTHAVTYHAQAATNERRSVDVEGALLHRPLLLDRRNAAYVLLANSSWWMLPWLSFQLLSSALIRSLGYLLAKLPGYAGDELLAVVTLLIKPATLINARKERKNKRLVSSRVISVYIPPRWSQTKNAIAGIVGLIRSKIFPVVQNNSTSVLQSLDDEDLLVPAKNLQWISILKKPEAAGYLLLALITLIASRNRWGSLSGGALPTSPNGASDLWSSYIQSWHLVGLGSSHATPPWILILAISSMLTFGKISLFITLLFLFAPLFMMWSVHRLLKKFSSNRFITIPASFLYAISPVALASINSGRLGTIVLLILAPQIPLILSDWKRVESNSLRRIFGLCLYLSLCAAFSLVTVVISLGVIAPAILIDYIAFKKDSERELFLARLYRRAALLFLPFLILAPYSFEALTKPLRFFAEPGLAIPGGTTWQVLLANPGGMGSMPLWLISPTVLILLVSLFTSSAARTISQYGILFISSAVIASVFSFSFHGNSAEVSVWTGTFLTVATLCAVVSGVVILDRVRGVLVSSNIHYRHILAALLLIFTTIYGVTSSGWAISIGAASPLHSGHSPVMPPFLAAEPETKILVLREIANDGKKSVQYYVSRGTDIYLGEPDIAPSQIQEIEIATQQLIDGTGLTSSKTLAAYGIKYVFVKNPFSTSIIQTIDGLGGFSRTSATSLGVVWRVSGSIGRLVFTSKDGVQHVLQSSQEERTITVPGAGTLTLTESFDRSWQILENGARLPRARNANGLAQFAVSVPGEVTLIHDGTIRRAWLSFQIIMFTLVFILALPAGRRRREISEQELS